MNDPALSKKDTGDFPALGTEFPSLGAAKEKKKKKQTMSLADFQSSGSGGRSSGRSYGDLPMGPRRFDINSLPTGPRVRGPGEEEDGPPMGGGFRGYGGDRDMDRRPSRSEQRYTCLGRQHPARACAGRRAASATSARGHKSSVRRYVERVLCSERESFELHQHAHGRMLTWLRWMCVHRPIDSIDDRPYIRIAE